MDVADDIFAHRIVKSEKLTDYGFKACGGKLVYERQISDGQFILHVIYADKAFSSCVTESATGDKYILYNVADAVGSFVGEIREEARKILEDIACGCTTESVFTLPQTLAVIDRAFKKYGDMVEYPWDKLDGDAVIRRSDNALWYAVILTVGKNKFWEGKEGSVEVIDVRALPERIDALVDGVTYFRGYHMNKTHWLTVPLDGRVTDEELFSLQDDSYSLAVKGKKTKKE